jgi:hypothetical protein
MWRAIDQDWASRGRGGVFETEQGEHAVHVDKE